MYFTQTLVWCAGRKTLQVFLLKHCYTYIVISVTFFGNRCNIMNIITNKKYDILHI